MNIAKITELDGTIQDREQCTKDLQERVKIVENFSLYEIARSSFHCLVSAGGPKAAAKVGHRHLSLMHLRVPGVTKWFVMTPSR